MGILKDQLTGSNLGLKGTTPEQRPGANKASTLHYESSINDNPDITQIPSDLDLNGKLPSVPGKVPYMDNLPG